MARRANRGRARRCRCQQAFRGVACSVSCRRRLARRWGRCGKVPRTDSVVVEDWSTSPLGARGIPPGWRGQSWTQSAYDLAVETDGPERVLHFRSQNDATLISKALGGRVELHRTPILEWRWKAVVYPLAATLVGAPRRPSRASVRRMDTPAGVVALADHRVHLGHHHAAGTVTPSESTRTVTYVVLRSGSASAGSMAHRASGCAPGLSPDLRRGTGAARGGGAGRGLERHGLGGRVIRRGAALRGDGGSGPPSLTRRSFGHRAPVTAVNV